MSFSEIFKIKKGSGKISLRRKQFEVALAGNPSMLIWLGKNMLGQAEKQELEVKTDDVVIDFGDIKGDDAE